MQTENPQRSAIRVQDCPVGGEHDDPAGDRLEEGCDLLLRVLQIALGLLERGDISETDHDIRPADRRADGVELDQEAGLSAALDQLHLGEIGLGLLYQLDILTDGGLGEDRKVEFEEWDADQVAGGVDAEGGEETCVHHADLQVAVQDQDRVVEAVEDLRQWDAPRRPVELLLSEPLHADIAALREEFEGTWPPFFGRSRGPGRSSGSGPPEVHAD